MQDDSVTVSPLDMDEFSLSSMEQTYFLVYTGLTRKATDILERQSASSEERRDQLDKLRQQAVEVREFLESGNNEAVGRLLASSWDIKRQLVDGITVAALDSLYDTVIGLGATGGKLLGAGGGGFFLFHAPPGIRDKVAATLDSEHRILSLCVDTIGSTIIFDDGSRL